MTQKEIQTIIKRANENSTHQYELGYEKAKEQMIEKACEWLRENANNYIYEDWGERYVRETKLDIDDLTETFKKYMEE